MFIIDVDPPHFDIADFLKMLSHVDTLRLVLVTSFLNVKMQSSVTPTIQLILDCRSAEAAVHLCLNSRADKTCFGKLGQLQKKGDKMPAKKVDKEFLQSCSFKVAEILQTQIDKLCKAAVQKFKQGYEDEIATLKAEISLLSNSQEFICTQYDILKIENDKLKKENATQSKKLRTLRANSIKIEKKAETEAIKLDGINQYSLRQNLEFHSVPQASNENVVDIVKIGKVLGVDINQNDISPACRLPQKPHLNRRSESEELPPPPGIFVCFINRDFQNFIYHKCAAAKDIARKDFPVDGLQRLYVNENLTQSRKHLLWQMKQAART